MASIVEATKILIDELSTVTNCSNPNLTKCFMVLGRMDTTHCTCTGRAGDEIEILRGAAREKVVLVL